jgi:hypothetical protein
MSLTKQGLHSFGVVFIGAESAQTAFLVLPFGRVPVHVGIERVKRMAIAAPAHRIHAGTAQWLCLRGHSLAERLWEAGK